MSTPQTLEAGPGTDRPRGRGSYAARWRGLRLVTSLERASACAPSAGTWHWQCGRW
ncbi:hypothetical protein [Brachybacterium sp. GPGPB12]|uniref:hypothetical protein n=1 Tax=Brachybacterium sp. GPGPB12 TaxID=3023517 RepID=UPI0031343ABC